MRPSEIAPAWVSAFNRVADRGQRGVRLVVVVGNLVGALPQPEVQQDRRDVVGQRPVGLSRLEECVPHDHVAEEGE